MALFWSCIYTRLFLCKKNILKYICTVYPNILFLLKILTINQIKMTNNKLEQAVKLANEIKENKKGV